MPSKQLLIILALVVVLGGAGAAWFLMKPNQSPAESSAGGPNNTSANAVVSTDRTLGNPKAKVVMIEYAALTCPVCAYFSQQIFPAFKAKYIDTGKVYYVYRLLPIDPADGKAEKIASCLPPAQYFSFIDLLYRRQADWGPEQHNEHGALAQPKTEAALLQMARVGGLSEDQARACMTSPKEDARINQVGKTGEDLYQVNATPTLIINDHVEPAGPIPLDQLSEIIDPLLK